MRRTRLSRKTKLRSKYRPQVKELDALCRQVVFARDGHRCCKTGRTDNLQWAHVYSRRYRTLRWDPDNSLCLNAGAHLEAHHRPLEFASWFEAAFPGRAKRLRLLMQTKAKVDLAALKLWLEQQLAGSPASCAPPPL